MGVLTRFLTVAFFHSQIHANCYLHFPVDDSSHRFTMLVHGEVVGSIRTHHALPVYRPFYYATIAYHVGLNADLGLPHPGPTS